jgi:hypothetical protein
VVIAVAGHFVAALGDRRQRLGISLGDAAAGHEGRLDLRLVEDAEDAPDAGVRAVFTLRVFFMIDLAVLIRLHVLAALEVESQRDRETCAVGPENFSLRMMLGQHAKRPPLERCGIPTASIQLSPRTRNRNYRAATVTKVSLNS